MIAAGLAAITAIAVTRGQTAGWLGAAAPAAMPVADYAGTAAGLLTDRGLLYVFGWLLPLAMGSLRVMPRPWRTAAATATLGAFAAGVVGEAESVNRAVMNVAGPLLCGAAACTLLRIVRAFDDDSRPSGRTAA
jgi:hypothetical protein